MNRRNLIKLALVITIFSILFVAVPLTNAGLLDLFRSKGDISLNIDTLKPVITSNTEPYEYELKLIGDELEISYYNYSISEVPDLAKKKYKKDIPACENGNAWGNKHCYDKVTKISVGNGNKKTTKIKGVKKGDKFKLGDDSTYIEIIDSSVEFTISPENKECVNRICESEITISNEDNEPLSFYASDINPTFYNDFEYSIAHEYDHVILEYEKECEEEGCEDKWYEENIPYEGNDMVGETYVHKYRNQIGVHYDNYLDTGDSYITLNKGESKTLYVTAIAPDWDSEYKYDVSFYYGGELWTIDPTYTTEGADFNNGVYENTTLDASNFVRLEQGLVESPDNSIYNATTGMNMTSNLVLLHMNNNWLDSSGNGRDGSVSGATFTTASQLGSHAGVFDGNNDYVDVGAIASNFYSFSAWLYFPEVITATHACDTIITYGTTDWENIVLGTCSGSAVSETLMIQGASGTRTYIKDDIQIGWHHVVVTWGGSAYNIYMDGVQKTSYTGTSGDTPLSAIDTLRIGRSSTAFLGTMDELAVWGRSLSTTEIANMYEHQNGKYYPQGVYESEIYDLIVPQIFNNISWTPEWDYNQEELPENQATSNGINMTGNVALLHMNDDLTDSSGNGNDATWTSGGTYTTGVMGKAAQTTGNYIQCGDTPYDLTKKISISFWMNIDRYYTGTVNYPAGKYGGDADSPFLFKLYGTSSGDYKKMDVYGNRGGTWGNVSGMTDELSLGRWYHVLWTYDNSTGGQLYMDGEAIGELTGSGNLATNNNNFAIGQAFGGVYWYGQVDEVAVWNRTLGAGEVEDVYQSGVDLHLNVSVRSCDDFLCDTETWNGTYDTSSYVDISDLTDNQYFQYKFDFLTGDTDFTPELYNVTFDYGEPIYPKPLINFIYPTETNATSIGVGSTTINVTIDGNGYDVSEVKFNWNGTNFTFYDESLVLLYSLNNESGIGESYSSADSLVNDSSMYEHSGTTKNGAGSIVADGRFGNSLYFDGSNDYIASVPSKELTGNIQNLTHCAWVKSSGGYWGSNAYISSIKRSDAQSTQLGLHAGKGGQGKLGFLTRHADDSTHTWIMHDGGYNDDEWHLDCAVINGTNRLLYIDGELKNSDNKGMQIVADADSTFTIGTYSSSSYRMKGYIDEVAFWNRTLGADEMEAYYEYGIARLNQTSYTLLIEKSGLSGGDYTYQACASNVNGENCTEERTITVDTFAPELNLIIPTSKTYTSTTVPINVSINEDANWCGYSLDGAVNVTMSSLNSTYWYESMTPLAEGSHSVITFCNDTFGNMGQSSTIIFGVDTFPPSISLVYPENNSFFSVGTGINLTYIPSPDGGSIDSCSLWLDGVENISIVSPNEDVENNFTFTSIPSGEHIWNVWCNESTGNSDWSAQGNLTFTIDSDNPVVNIIYPIATTYTDTISEMNFSYVETSPDTCWYSDSSSVNETFSCLQNLTGLVSFSGNNTWSICMNDSSGNEGCDEVTFTRIVTDFDVTIISPNARYINTVDLDFNLSFIFGEGINVSSCLFSFDNFVTNYTMTPLNETFCNYTYEDMNQGNYFAKFWINDTSNNINADETYNFTIDRESPTVSLSEPTNSLIWKLLNIDFIYLPVDNVDTSLSCSLYLNGVNFGTNSTSLNNTLSTIRNSPIMEDRTDYVWYINCTDGVNYGVSDNRNIKIDSTYHLTLSEGGSAGRSVDCWKIDDNTCVWEGFMNNCPVGYFEFKDQCADYLVDIEVEDAEITIEEFFSATPNVLQKLIEKLFPNYEPNDFMGKIYELNNFYLFCILIMIIILILSFVGYKHRSQ